MTPPPPPPLLRVPWRDEGPRLDPALDDAPLAAARDAFTQGRWTDARSLLLDTGTDWERRGHRLLVLAESTGCAAWAEEWQLTEPESADAAALLACATVWTAVRGKALPETARKAIEDAALRAPDDPTPWLAALLLARHTGEPRDCRNAFEEVRARHPDHHHAHHLMTAVLADAADGPEDPAVYDFAADAAARAPADSPLALLPVVAHAEHFRARHAAARTGGSRADAAVGEHWAGRRAQHLVRCAFDWWLEWGGEERHPRRLIDLNFLAHAKFHEGRLAEAAALFQRLGNHATPAPWSYTGRDPRKAFRAARGAALGPA